MVVERLAFKGPVPTLLLPLTMCSQVTFVQCWGGIGEFDLDGRFCTHFLLPIEDGNHDVPEHLAPFVHSPCRMVRKRSDRAIELDDIGFVIDGSFVCGYPQFRMTWLRSVFKWLGSVSELWLTDLYGPIYETNALILNGDMLKVGLSLPPHRAIHSRHSL